MAEFQQTLLLHPGNQHAANELQRALRELRRQQAGPTDLEAIKEQARLDAMGPPRLDPKSDIPIVLNFKKVEVGKIFEARTLKELMKTYESEIPKQFGFAMATVMFEDPEKGQLYTITFGDEEDRKRVYAEKLAAAPNENERDVLIVKDYMM